MRLADSFVAELDAEAAATRRVLERLPEAHFAWRPHGKSSSLGQLALHVAVIPERLTGYVTGDVLDFTKLNRQQQAPASLADVLAAFDASLHAARTYFAGLDDARAAEIWHLVAGDTELFAAPRAAVIRSFLFNHLYHHRGQLLVYLRMLDVSVPSVYGPSADESPFAGVA
jgi:uncharacterized damage-inducible protein DinB